LYHAMEKSYDLELEKIDANVIDDAIKQTYPGLRVKGSIMDVPISDFITIRKNCDECSNEKELKEAVCNLANFAHKMGNICKLEKQNLALDVMYEDSFGAKVGIAVVTNPDGSSSLDEISNISKSAVVDKLVILTNQKIPSPYNATIVNMDKPKMVDLIYFNSKYAGKKIAEPDKQRAENLARTLNII
jgi:hypothetical protein